MRGGFVRGGRSGSPCPEVPGPPAELPGARPVPPPELRGPAPGEVDAAGVDGSLGAVYRLLLLFTKLWGNTTCEECIPVIPAAVLGGQRMEAQPSVG